VIEADSLLKTKCMRKQIKITFENSFKEGIERSLEKIYGNL
jgi:hypothetical protein